MTLQDIDVGRRPAARSSQPRKARAAGAEKSLLSLVRDPKLRRILRRAAAYDDALVIAGVDPAAPIGDAAPAVALLHALLRGGEVIGHGPDGRTFLLFELSEGAFLSLCGWGADREDFEDTGDDEPDFDNEAEPEEDPRFMIARLEGGKA